MGVEGGDCATTAVPAHLQYNRGPVRMHTMNDPSALAGMLPFDTIGLYEQPKPRFIFKMPRVVPDQKSKFESDELFRRLSRESEVSVEMNSTWTPFVASTRFPPFFLSSSPGRKNLRRTSNESAGVFKINLLKIKSSELLLEKL